MIEPRVVKQKPPSNYPTRLEVSAQPELLEKHQPAGWRRTEFGIAAAFLVAGTLSACYPVTHRSATVSQFVSPAPNSIHVFERSVIACVAVVPPIFLSEEEALQVIKEELESEGVELAQTDVGLHLPASAEEEPLAADAFDPAKRVAVEFVSRSDGDQSSMPKRFASTYYHEKITDAEALIPDETAIYLGVFHEPNAEAADTPFDRLQQYRMRDTARKAIKNSSRFELRRQVRDFIEWLKGQGVI